MSTFRQSLAAASKRLATGGRSPGGAPPPGGPQGIFDLNGSPVTAIATAGNTHSTVSGGTGTVRSLPPHCYGDPSVAAELLDCADSNNAAVEPVGVCWIGTSRSSGIVIGTLAHTTVGGLPWGGVDLSFNGLGSTAWTVAWINSAANDAVAAFGTYLGRYAPGSAQVATCNGGVAPSGNETVNRMIYSETWTMTSRVHAHVNFYGRGATARAYYLAGPDGITGAHVRFGVRIQGSLTQFAYSNYFSTYNETYEVRYVDVAIPPVYSWVDAPAVNFDVTYRNGQATVSGEKFTFFGYNIFTNRGINLTNLAVGGRWTRDYANVDIFGQTIFRDFVASMPGTKKQLWIELGCNGTGVGFQTVAQDRADKELIISRFRAECPDGGVVLLSSYPGSVSPPGSSTWYREADIQIAANLPRVLAVDTQRLMPGYQEAVALGYYGVTPDGVHYDDTGRAAWLKAYANSVKQCANAAA